jgi:peptidoglycan/xylan/chitin deacetylase (PgdA/CDA1 family)
MSRGALVLTYHAVEEGPAPLCIRPPLFAEHLDAIVASGRRSTTVAGLADTLIAGGDLDDLVVITFDDAFASVPNVAWPQLAERGLTSTVFCVAGHLDGANDWPSQHPSAPRRRLAGRDELAAIAAAGGEIGSHGLTHAPLDTDDRELVRRELSRSKALLEEALDVAVRTLAWPYGVSSSVAAEIASAAGYVAACAGAGARVRPDSDLFALPRVDAHYVRRPTILRAVLRGSLTPYLGARRIAAGARRQVRKDYVH